MGIWQHIGNLVVVGSVTVGIICNIHEHLEAGLPLGESIMKEGIVIGGLVLLIVMMLQNLIRSFDLPMFVKDNFKRQHDKTDQLIKKQDEAEELFKRQHDKVEERFREQNEFNRKMLEKLSELTEMMQKNKHANDKTSTD